VSPKNLIRQIVRRQGVCHQGMWKGVRIVKGNHNLIFVAVSTCIMFGMLLGCVSRQPNIGQLPQEEGKKDGIFKSCGNCGGKGKIKCIICNGKGEVGTCDNYWVNRANKTPTMCQGGYFPCPDCKGEFKSLSGIGCNTCNSEGKLLCTLCQGSGMKPCTVCGGKIEGPYLTDMVFHGSKGNGFYTCPVCNGRGKPFYIIHLR